MQGKLGFLKRGANNQQALRGIMKSYKVLDDYTFARNQPWYSRAYLKWHIHQIKSKLVLESSLYTPHYLSTLIIGATAFFIFIRAILFERAPTYMMTQGDMKNREMFALQFENTTNPDDSFDSILMCWRSDPLCGIDVAPKRPQETLKDPKKNLVRLHWDNRVNPHVALSGGFY